MKVNLDDPNLTAFALGELSPDDHAKMAEAVADSAEAQSYVAETQQFARLLRAEYEADRQQPAAPRSPIAVRMEEERRASWRYQWGSLAAALAIFGVIAAVAITAVKREAGVLSKPLADNLKRPAAPVEVIPEPTVEMEVAQQPVEPQPTTAPSTADAFRDEKQDAGGNAAAGKYAGLGANAPPPPATRSMPKPAGGEATESEPPSRYRQDFNTASYDKVEENPFLPAGSNPLSTFSIDVDTASYANVRRFLNPGPLPPKDAVRIEEMINYFPYDYPPAGRRQAVLGRRRGRRLPVERRATGSLRIGLKGREIANDKRPAEQPRVPARRLRLDGPAQQAAAGEDRPCGCWSTAAARTTGWRSSSTPGPPGLVLPSTSCDHKAEILRASTSCRPAARPTAREGSSSPTTRRPRTSSRAGINRVILATDGDFNVGVTTRAT